LPASPRLSLTRRAPARTGGLLALCLCAVGLVAGGCGGSTHTAGTSADPASAIPASAPLYAGAVVRPTGALASEAQAAGKVLTHQSDPFLRLLAALQTPGSAKLDYAHDVAPWLGPHAAIFLTSLASTEPLLNLLEQGLLGGSGASFPFGSGGAQGAIVMDTTDPEGARSFLTGQAQHAGARAQTYRGVSYEATSGGLAFGLVDRFAVIGSQGALRSVIDTTQGGGALSKSGTYSKLLAVAPQQALAHIYVNPLAQSAGAAPGSSSTSASGGVLSLLTGSRPANISVLAKAGSLSLDADSLSPSGGATASTSLLSPSPEAASALVELPGDAWLAIGLPSAARGLPADISGLKGLTSLLGGSGVEAQGTLSLGSLLAGLLTPLEVMGAPTAEARRDYGRWMGSAGVFAGGSGLLNLQAAVVLDSSDATLSRAAVADLGHALRAQGAKVQSVSIPGTEAAISAAINGLPLALYVGAGRTAAGAAKFVLGLGEASIGAALNPTSTLASAASRTAAATSIGEGAQPSLILDTPTLLSLLEGVGLTESPSLSGFVPFLRSITTIAGGGRELSAEVSRYRLVINLAQAEG
jgi:hypothetical protein